MRSRESEPVVEASPSGFGSSCRTTGRTPSRTARCCRGVRFAEPTSHAQYIFPGTPVYRPEPTGWPVTPRGQPQGSGAPLPPGAAPEPSYCLRLSKRLANVSDR
jgi:hypothetical protein